MEVDRCSDRLIRVKLVTRDGLLNIISAYSPQTALQNEEKEAFFDNFEQKVRKIPDEEKVIICEDVNAHIGRISEGFKNTHGGFGYGQKNDDGERTLEVAQSLDLIFANTLFKKKEEHLVTYKSGGSTSQIDFILVKRKDRKEILNCKVIPGEDLTKQHRLIVMDYKIRKEKKVENVKITKLRVWKLQDIQSKIQFQNKVKEEMSKREKKDDVNGRWQDLKMVLMTEAENIVRKTRGGKQRQKETWWWNEEVQEALRTKKKAFKILQNTNSMEDLETYRTAKRAVSIAKWNAATEWYNKLETREGQKTIYKIAQARQKSKEQLGNVNAIKNKQGKVLFEGKDILIRWAEYFKELLNRENEREKLETIKKTEGPIKEVSTEEVRKAIKKMKAGKATGPSDTSIELIKALDEYGIGWITELMQTIFRDGKMPDDWRKSTIIPIFKRKGDVLECKNYRGIKLMEHVLKALERIIEGRLRELIEISDN